MAVGTSQRVTGHVLFMDIVQYTTHHADRQVELIEKLEQIAGETEAYRRAEAGNELVSLQTGDGLALAFLRDPVAPIECAVEVSLALQSHPEVRVRMGMHSGLLMLRKDFKAQDNVTGDGIDMAKRIMDFGEAGHILASANSVHFPRRLTRWSECIHDVGFRNAKHDVPLHVFNVYGPGFGNPEPPPARERKGGDDPLPGRAPAILTEIVSVWHNHDEQRDTLIYAHGGSALGEAVRPPDELEIDRAEFTRQLDHIRDDVDAMIRQALTLESRRENREIESAAAVLAEHVIPVCGFGGMLAANHHPHIATIQDAASEIPWEIMGESYLHCPHCQLNLPPRPAHEHCGRCGGKLQRVSTKLALTRHLTHQAQGSDRPVGNGRDFLIVADADGDLCGRNDREGRCREHLEELQRLIRAANLEPRLLTGDNARIEPVLSAIGDPAVVACYYFGHGYFTSGGREGCLWLKDGPLTAGQIAKAARTPKFVFLNACEGAKSGRNWGLEKRTRSVADAFARGGRGRVVIAPIWPVVNFQAAEFARCFFGHAFAGMALAEAVQKARAESLARYETQRLADLCWGAYRYFGDPNKALPLPVEPAAPVVSPEPRSDVPGPVAVVASRLFDAGAQLDPEQFAFSIDEVLLRAANRRNLEGRATVTVFDFLAGLLRKGDLTRFLLRQEGLDPDELYEGKVAESTVRAVSPAELLRELKGEGRSEEEREAVFRSFLARWLVRGREDFSAELLEVFQQADRRSQQRLAPGDDQRISEQDLLEAFIECGRWTMTPVLELPPPERIRRRLRERQDSAAVDANGAISLEALAPEARQIIETAHALSQQRGIFPIAHRVMLAAFLSDAQGHAARVFQAANLDPQLFYLLMIAMTQEDLSKKPSPKTFALSAEACSRIVTPVLEEAGRLAGGRLITPRDLFAAFCGRANTAFKTWLKEPPEPVADLDVLRTVEPGVGPAVFPLSPEAQRVVERAHELAQACGIFPIPTRLVLAAFLRDPEGATARLFEAHHLAWQSLCEALIEASRTPAAREFPCDERACARIVTPMLQRARELAPAGGADSISEEMLFKALCKVIDPGLKELLKSSEWQVDLDALVSGKSLPPPAVAEEFAETAPADGPARKFSRNEFDDVAWQVLGEAVQLARARGWSEVRSPHLLAALIGDGAGAAGELLRATGARPLEVRALVLTMVPPRAPTAGASPGPGFGETAARTLRGAREAAAAARQARATVRDILQAMFADGGGAVGELLRASGVRWPTFLAAHGTDVTTRARYDELPPIPKAAVPAPQPPAPVETGGPQMFAHFEVLRHEDGSLFKLGRGQMGTTYKAFDTRLHCVVALKVINASLVHDPLARRRFLREARAAARLRHPNVASVSFLGEENGTDFYAMEFVEGEDLEKFVERQGRLAPLTALQLAHQAARALVAAKRQDLIHRDIKPANLMVTGREGGELELKLIDFGLAKGILPERPGASRVTVSGFLGSPAFASPEQCAEQELDARSDIYSLGVTLWFMLTAETPFEGSPGQVISAHQTRTPPFERLAHLPAEIVSLLRRMLAKDPAQRPQMPLELEREIARIMRELPEGAPAPVPEPAEDRERLFKVARDTTVIRRDPPPAPEPVPGEHERLAAEIARAGEISHPGLVRYFSLEETADGWSVTREQIHGFALFDLLRRRRKIPVGEVLHLLGELPGAIDYAVACGLGLLEISLRKVFVHFPAEIDPQGFAKLWDTPVPEWPAFALKLDPVNLDPLLADRACGTILPKAELAHPEPGDAVGLFAALVYELLGGLRETLRPSGGQGSRYIPLGDRLGEGANAVLRSACLEKRVFVCCADFWQAFRAAGENRKNRPE